MNKQPLVSVIIPSFNAAKFLSQTIESVLEQTYKNVEVVVVDDGSTDGTEKVIKKYPVQYIGITHSGIPAKPRNVGLEKAHGELIAFLDSDDIWLPTKLEKQVNFLRRYDYDLVHCDGSVIDERGKIFKESFHQDIPVPSGKVFPELFKGNFIVTSSVLAKRECFDKVGGFEVDRSFLVVDDYDLWLRIAPFFKIGYLKTKLFLYRERKESISDMGEMEGREYEFRALRRNFPMAKKLMGIESNLRLLHLCKLLIKGSQDSPLRGIKYKFFSKFYLPWETLDLKLIRRLDLQKV